jgi:hypothetical protein
MKNTIRVLLAILIMSLASYSLAHSGRTDAYGGHKCSQKSINKGLCSGYHYHNGLKIEQSTQVDVDLIQNDSKEEIKIRKSKIQKNIS